MLPSKKMSNWLPGIVNELLGNEWVAKVNHFSTPAVNIIENDKEYKVEVAAPGITKESLKIKVRDDNYLVIFMNKKDENEENSEKKEVREKYLRREFSYAHFNQVLALPENVDKDNLDAKWDNGVLRITLPKKDVVREEGAKEVEIH